MGVPKFRSLLPVYALKNAELTAIPPIKNAYFDMNNLYWRVIRTRNSNQGFLPKTQMRINEIYHRFKPSNLVYFAIDGASPVAKIHLQRDRRITSDQSKFSVNPLQLSPGTEFMERLKDHLCHVGAYMVDNAKNSNFEVIISGGGTPDEGEHKIFRHINEHNVNGTNLVIGGDADLFLYALRSPAPVYILNDETLELISIQKMKENLLNGVTTPKSKEQACLDDFVFLALLLGNDYLPRLRHFNLQTAWASYLDLKKTRFQNENLFSETTVIHPDFASELFGEVSSASERLQSIFKRVEYMQPKSILFELFQLAKSEAMSFHTVETSAGKFECVVKFDGKNVGVGTTHNKRQAEAKAAAEALMSEHMDKLLDEFPEKVRQRAIALVKRFRLQEQEGGEKIQEIPKKSQSESNDMVEEYLEGLGWSMKYYKGECVNYGYHYPYEHSPDVKKLVNYKTPVTVKTTDHPPLSSVEVLMAILPHTAREFVPKPYSKLLEEDSPLKHIFIDGKGESKSWDKKEVVNNMKLVKRAIGALGETIKEHDPPVQISRAPKGAHSDWKFVAPTLPDWVAKPISNPLVCKVEQNNTFILKENKYMQQVIKRSMRNTSFTQKAFKNVLSFVKI